MRSLKEAEDDKYRFIEIYFKLQCPECHEWYVFDYDDIKVSTVIYNPIEKESECFTFKDGKLTPYKVKEIVSSEPFKDLITLTCPICGKEHTFNREELEEKRIRCNYFGEDNTIYFELSGKSYEEAQEFIKEHDHSEEFKAQGKMGFSTLGQQFSYIFTPGGLGDSIEIRCNHCGENKDITDTENW